MNKLTTLILLFTISIPQIQAQDSVEETYLQNVQTLDSTIKTLYSVISGEKNTEHNWSLFKYLFKPNAEITLEAKNSEGNYVKYYMSVDEYINTYGKWLTQNGFFENEIDRTISTFRHMNHVSSKYESFSSKLTKKNLQTGVNNINLVNENNRWYISNIKWRQDIKGKQIPKEYLPIPKG